VAQDGEYHGYAETYQPQSTDKRYEVVAIESHLLQLQTLEEVVELPALRVGEEKLQRVLRVSTRTELFSG